jgi:predicted HTH transcriptional regulator
MSALAIRLDLGARMSSRQIGEVVKASHDNVLKTVRSLMDRGIVSANDTPYVHPQNGQIYTEYLLDFRNTMVVASGYKAKLRAEIIDRWIELETAARANPAPSEFVTRAELEARLSLIHVRQVKQLPAAQDRVLEFVRERGAVTKSELLRRFRDLSAVGVSHVISRLNAEGRIEILLVRPQGDAGRPATTCRWVQ